MKLLKIVVKRNNNNLEKIDALEVDALKPYIEHLLKDWYDSVCDGDTSELEFTNHTIRGANLLYIEDILVRLDLSYYKIFRSDNND